MDLKRNSTAACKNVDASDLASSLMSAADHGLHLAAKRREMDQVRSAFRTTHHLTAASASS
jgi:hypothetical protein